MAVEKPRLTVYDCKTQAAKIATLAATIAGADLYAATDDDAKKLNKFDTRVQPWTEDCDFKYPRYHFVLTEGNQIQGWMLVDIRTHTPKRGRTWTYVYLDKVSVRNGTRGVGKQLGDYLKTWATSLEPKIDFIWLWAIDERVSSIYESSWDYKRVQYYDGYGFMFYTIRRPPPLSMLQSDPPESPRKFWVAADTIAKMNPRNEPLVRLIAEKRRGNAEGVKNVVEPLMEELNDIPADEVAGVQEQLQGVLKTGGRRRTRRRKTRRRLTHKRKHKRV